jgi:hypothetical protein
MNERLYYRYAGFATLRYAVGRARDAREHLAAGDKVRALVAYLDATSAFLDSWGRASRTSRSHVERVLLSLKAVLVPSIDAAR